MIFVVEYVCTANGGRSPQFQTIVRHYVAKKGLEDKIEVRSSGSQADDVQNFNFPMLELISYTEIGVKKGTFQGEISDVAQYLVAHKESIAKAAEQGDKEAKDMIIKCNKYLMDDEIEKRNAVLGEIGLVAQGPFHKQTVASPDVQLILPMKQSNANKVKKIYEGSGFNPVIIPICEYAGIGGEVADPFGGDIKDYRKARDFIANVGKLSLDKAIIEYNIK